MHGLLLGCGRDEAALHALMRMTWERRRLRFSPEKTNTPFIAAVR
jgi:hypothetical protein